MKSIAALALLTFLLVVLLDAAPTKDPNQTTIQHLKQIIYTANELETRHKIMEKWVSSDFDKSRCEPKDFCIAEKILKPIIHKHKLLRALSVYNEGNQNCSYSLSHQYHLETLLEDIKNCVHVLLQKVDTA